MSARMRSSSSKGKGKGKQPSSGGRTFSSTPFSSSSSSPSTSSSSSSSKSKFSKSNSKSSNSSSSKPSRIRSTTNLYDSESGENKSAFSDLRRFDREATKNYQFELPDNWEDEEVNEDQAFSEKENLQQDDEIREFLAPKPTKGKGRRQEEEEEEEEEEFMEEDYEEGSIINLSDMLDDKPAASKKSSKSKPNSSSPSIVSTHSNSSSSSSSSLSSSSPSSSSSRPISKVQSSKKSKQVIQEYEAEEEEEELEQEENEEDQEDEEKNEEAEEEEEVDVNELNDEFEVEEEDAENEVEEEEEEGVEEEDRSSAFGAEEEDDDEDDEDEDEDEIAAKHAQLLSAIEQLENEQQQLTSRPSSRKPRIEERSEAFAESEFALTRKAGRAEGDDGDQDGELEDDDNGELSVNDLINSLKSSSSSSADSSLSSSSLTRIQRQLHDMSKSKTTRTLIEPLSELHEEAIERKLNYTAAKDSIQKWTPIIARNRDASTLSFPLNPTPLHRPTTASFQSTFLPSSSSSLETDLSSLMKQYGLSNDITEMERKLREEEERQLQERSFTAEEINKRQIELQKMRSLLFSQELKMKRIHKIKSKTYRKLLRKKKEKQELNENEMKDLLSGNELKMQQEKAAIERAKERMSLQHTHSSKWMKRQLMLNKTVKDRTRGSREAIAEQMKQADELRKKIIEMDDAEAERRAEEDSDPDEYLENDDDDPDKPVRSRASLLRAELRALEADIEAQGGEGGDDAAIEAMIEEEIAEQEGRGFEVDPIQAAKEREKREKDKQNASGLFGLKFMQRANDKKKQEAREMIKDVEKEIEDYEKLEEVDKNGGEVEQEDVEVRKSGQQSGRKSVGGKLNTLNPSSSSSSASLDSSSSSRPVTFLPSSFQSSQVGLNRGHKVRVDKPIHVDVETEVEIISNNSKRKQERKPNQDVEFAVRNQDVEFAVEQFSDDEATGSLNKTKAAMKQRNGNGKAATNGKLKGVKVTMAGGDVEEEWETEAAAQLDPHSNPTALPRRSRIRQGLSSSGSSSHPAVEANNSSSTSSSSSTINPWAQDAIENARKEVRESEKNNKKNNKKRQNHSQNDSDPALSGDKPITLDVNAALLLAADPPSSSSSSSSSSFNLLGSSSSQAALVRAAFSSGGEEESSFLATKSALIESELPELDAAASAIAAGRLPGWGSWGGSGTVPRKETDQQRRRKEEARSKLEKQKQSILAARSDSKLEHVIISDKVDKKLVKYLVEKIPFPFTSVIEYESSLRQPLGEQWNALKAFEAAVKPAVITKLGEIIEPIKFDPNVSKEGKAKMKDKRKEASASATDGARSLSNGGGRSKKRRT